MSLRYPGGLITKSPTAPTTSAAKGVWTLEQALQYIKAGTWPLSALGDPYFQYNTMLLPGQGTNGAQNNTFLDSSTNNFTITRNGNSTQGTFTPFSGANGNWSNYFDGTSSYLTGGAGSGSLGSGNFTLEAFVYATSTPQTYNTIFSNYTAFGTTVVLLYFSSDSKVNFVANNTTITSTAALQLNTWNHVAAVRNSGTITLYVNGVAQATLSYSGSSSGNGVAYVGTAGDAPTTTEYTGFISNLRVVAGSAVYTSAFTPPTSPLTAISNTIFLTCQSNRFVDNSTNAYSVTSTGSPAVTPFQPFGAPTTAYSASTIGGSGYFDGSGDYLSSPIDAAFQFGTGDFTIESWWYPTTISSTYQSIAGVWLTSQYGWLLQVRSTDVLVAVGGGSFTVVGSATIAPNQWHHVAATRSGTTVRVFLNGVLLNSGTSSASATASTPLQIARNEDGNQQYVNGYLSGTRLVKGGALYTATFTPPTSPPTTTVSSGTVSLLLNYTNAGIIDNAEKNDVETVANAQISTAQYKWGTSSMYFDGTTDCLFRSTSPNFGYGTGDFTIEFWLYLNAVGTQTIVSNLATSGSTAPHIYYLSGSGLKYFTASAARIDGPALSTGTWYHIAVSRTSGSTKMFVNGNQVGSTYADTNNYDATAPLGVGDYGSTPTGTSTLNGYVADLRITKGYARYPYNFTAPTAALPLFWQAAATPSSDPYFDYTTLLLPGNGTNGAQNNTFLDSSTNAFTVTRNGNTTQGTFTPFSQTGWGNYFAGSQSISAAASTDFQFAGDFTIESWIYPTTTGADNFFIQNSGSNYFAVNVNAGTGFEVFLNSSTPTFSPTDIVPPLNQWSHIALVRSGSTVKLYLNGVASTTTSTNSSTVGYNAIFYVGAFGTSSTGPFVGYASNFRVVNGTAVYTTNFTPPTSPLSAITNTKLLTCQSNRFIDNSSGAKAITLNGSPTVQAFSPFNPTAAYSTSTVGGSGYFDGSGDYLTAASNSAFAVGSTFTIEFWLYPTAYGANPVFIFLDESSGGLQFGLNSGNLGVAAAGVAWRLTGSAGPTLNAWNHCVLVRSGTGSNQTSIFLNGTRIANGTVTDAWTTNVQAIIQSTQGTSYLTTGYMSNIRIVKGTAVYDPTQSTLTVPTAPLTAVSGTSLLLSGTNGAIIDNTAKNNLETVGNASISTTQSKFGGSSMYFDGTGDYLTFRSNPHFAFGTGDFTIEAWVYPTSTAAVKNVCGTRGATGSTTAWNWGILTDSSIQMYSNGNIANTGANSVPINTWTYVAFVRYGGTIYGFVNGVLRASTANTQDFTVTDFWVGATGGSIEPYLGYINDLRITKGIARYTQNFTPPTTAFLTL